MIYLISFPSVMSHMRVCYVYIEVIHGYAQNVTFNST